MIESGLDMSAAVWAVEMLCCPVLLQGFALILIILAKLFKASIKEVSKVSVTGMGRPERAWGSGSEEQSTGRLALAAAERLCPCACSPSA